MVRSTLRTAQSRRAASRALSTGALVLAISIVTSCMIPVFDLDTTLAYRTAARMTSVATIGPFDFRDDKVSSAADYYYVPSAVLTPDYGTLVTSDGLGANIHYFAPNALDNVIREIGGDGFDRDPFRPAELDLYVSPMRSSTTDDAVFVGVRSANTMRLRIYRVNLAASSLVYPDFGAFTDADLDTLLAGRTKLLGVSLDISDSTSVNDTLAVFTGDTALPDTIHLDRASITDTFPGTLTAGGTAAIPGTTLPEAGYGVYNAERDTFVVSPWLGDAYGAAVQSTAGSVAALPVHERIDVVLSDGSLYHRGDTEDRVYSPTGALRFVIPTGRLRFAWETDSSPRTMIYTLAYFDTTQPKDLGNLFVNVYSIPTSELSALE